MPYFTKRRRDRFLGEPMSPAEQRTLRASLGFYPRLTGAERARLEDLARVIVHEKRWEGCAGLSLTDEMKLIIAAQAALLLLGMDDLDPHAGAVFPNVHTVLVYPEGFVNTLPQRGPAGVVTEGEAHLGEAHLMGASGPVLVSWRHALSGGLDGGDGHNLILHEFAHKLDFLDGVVNGTPPLASKDQHSEWAQVMKAHFDDLTRRAHAGAPSLLRYYGATNPGEFFAVATEVFFERGPEMSRLFPDLYRVLKGYYRQDPARWP